MEHGSSAIDASELKIHGEETSLVSAGKNLERDRSVLHQETEIPLHVLTKRTDNHSINKDWAWYYNKQSENETTNLNCGRVCND